MLSAACKLSPQPIRYRRSQIPFADPKLIFDLASKRRDNRYSRGYDARDRDHDCGYDCARGSAQLDADVEGLG